MNRIRLALLSLAMVAACKDPPAATAAPTPDAAGQEPVEWTLTLSRLDGYLRYQRALIAQAPRDAGAGEATVEERAGFDERTRQEAGLSVEDVEKIEAMISVLASRRLATRMTGADEPVPLPPQEKEKLSPEQTEQLARSMTARDTLLKASKSLEDERARFGTRNIDVLLQREAELLKNWALMMGLSEEKGDKR